MQGETDRYEQPIWGAYEGLLLSPADYKKDVPVISEDTIPELPLTLQKTNSTGFGGDNFENKPLCSSLTNNFDVVHADPLNPSQSSIRAHATTPPIAPLRRIGIFSYTFLPQDRVKAEDDLFGSSLQKVVIRIV